MRAIFAVEMLIFVNIRPVLHLVLGENFDFWLVCEVYWS